MSMFSIFGQPLTSKLQSKSQGAQSRTVAYIVCCQRYLILIKLGCLRAEQEGMTNNECAVIVGVRWVAHYKCARSSSRRGCDRVELACSSHPSICASSSSLHPCLSLSRSTFISLNLPRPTPLSLSLPSLSSALFGKDDWVWRYDGIFPVIIMN